VAVQTAAFSQIPSYAMSSLKIDCDTEFKHILAPSFGSFRNNNTANSCYPDCTKKDE